MRGRGGGGEGAVDWEVYLNRSLIFPILSALEYFGTNGAVRLPVGGGSQFRLEHVHDFLRGGF